jgi:exoribonuclease II
MTDKDREAFEAWYSKEFSHVWHSQIGAEDTNHYNAQYDCWQAARAESAKEINELKESVDFWKSAADNNLQSWKDSIQENLSLRSESAKVDVVKEARNAANELRLASETRVMGNLFAPIMTDEEAHFVLHKLRRRGYVIVALQSPPSETSAVQLVRELFIAALAHWKNTMTCGGCCNLDSLDDLEAVLAKTDKWLKENA